MFDYKELHPTMRKITKKIFKEKRAKLEKSRLKEEKALKGKIKPNKISSMKTMSSFRDLDDIMKVTSCKNSIPKTHSRSRSRSTSAKKRVTSVKEVFNEKAEEI